ncbi:TonB-dependent receptor [Bacteroides acidifaciens]|uniref:TonB-dependent receptor n=1 Tax=Bacteroides acidifaciens TaxID=85831 RepID=UPI0023D6BF17|nr:TonB-dependent receptor [Bacteroides acidifaciens]MDE6820061.1 TonB-dependent receptor [Bacteroides acidifaciens]
MKQSLYIIGGLALAISMPSSLQAQTTQPKDTTMNRTVVVEQEYNPDIMDASKVNVLPKVEEPTVSKKEVEYATTFFPATSVPAGLMNPYTGKEIQPGSTPGYVRAGYGNLGNLDILANYLFRLSDKDKLNIRFQMDGMDGKLTLPFTDGEKWNAFYYRTRANVDYTHQFNKLDLNIAGNFGLSNFNFRPGSVNSKQKFTSGDFHAGIHFIDETAPLRFNAETNLLMYERQHNMLNENDANTALKETIIRTKGDVTGAIGDQQSVTIALEMNNLLYSGYTKNTATGDDYFKNYTTLLLNPYYELDNDDWKLHVGANVDLSFGFDKSFRVSPDITAQYIFSDSYVLYAKATGGKLLNDFRRLENVCPYADSYIPALSEGSTILSRTFDTYEQVNASIGFKASPYTGVWFRLFGGYQNLKNDLMYSSQALITSSTGPIGNTLAFQQENTSNVYAGGEFTYDYKDILSVTARYTYRNWSSSRDEYLPNIKPENEVSVSLGLQPVSALRVNIGYDYIGRKQEPVSFPMSDVNDLYIGVSYNVFKGVSVYAQVHNLLNKKYQYYIGYPAEGFNFLGGLSFRF